MRTPIHPFVANQHPAAIAHRGGGREWPENSVSAFTNVTDLGYRYVETDVRATSDGQVMVFHDATLNRVTDRVGRISALPYSEVRKARISGRDRVMTLEELFTKFPDTFVNIDVKDDHTLEPLLRLINRMDVLNRICLGSFSAMRLRTVRSRLGSAAATSLTAPEVASLVAASQLGPFARIAELALPDVANCVQVPIRQTGIPIITPRFVSAAHRRGLAVHAWTIDDEPTMHRLLDMGVDGIMTDRPTLLRSVLRDRGQWESRP